MIVGAASFIISVLVLEQSIHTIVLGAFKLQNIPAVYILYGALMAGIFEESARFISYQFLKKKYNGVCTGLSYGVGHGGIESILLVGITMVGNLVFCIIINTGNVEILTKNGEGAALARLNAQIGALVTVKPYVFLIGGLERIFAIGVQISLAVMVYYAVFCKNKRYLYPLAIIIHAVVDIPAMLLQTGIIKQIAVVEILTGISAVVLILLAKKLHERITIRNT
jgi:uncharacterized membrane protein YhfC